jgi:NADH dehydrogenase/NADH:ubiquinone oxidoreductase subunit G
MEKGQEERREYPCNPMFRNYERLVEITIHGKKFQVPDKNTLLRAFQYISPDTIPYGRFCWNQECQLCRVVYSMPYGADSTARPVLACKMLVAHGMQIVELSDELKWTLRGILARTKGQEIPKSEA